MLTTNNLYNCFLEQYNFSNPGINTIAFQLLCLEPFIHGSFTDKQLSKLIDLSINLTNLDKVNIAKEALNKAYESTLLLEDKIYYLLIAVCVTIYLKQETLTQEHEAILNVIKTQSIDYLDSLNEEYPHIVPNFDIYQEQMCF